MSQNKRSFRYWQRLLTSAYLAWLPFWLITALWILQYKREGILSSRKYEYIFAEGEYATVLVSIFVFVSIGSLAYCLTLSRQYFKLKKQGKIIYEAPEKLPEYVICPNCKEAFSGQDSPNMKCKQCDCELEDLKGYYKRHSQ